MSTLALDPSGTIASLPRRLIQQTHQNQKSKSYRLKDEEGRTGEQSGARVEGEPALSSKRRKVFEK
jgi:hypothetical protein